MQELPASIGRCKALASLSLAHNHLRSLPPQIAFCSALAELSVRDNALTDVGAGVPKLPALRLLDVCNNELSNLPPALGYSTTLRAIPLTGNPMRSIPRQIRDGVPPPQLLHRDISLNLSDPMHRASLCLVRLQLSLKITLGPAEVGYTPRPSGNALDT